MKALTATLDDHKAQDLVTLNISKQSSFTDYLLIATGTSTRHVASLAKALLEHHGAAILSVEGQQTAEWVVVDCGGVVVHLFIGEKRTLYNLEKLWSFPF